MSEVKTETAAQPNENVNRTTIDAKKVYLKDASFESPASPEIFARENVQPDMDVQMTLTHKRLDDEFFEVVLSTTVSATHEKKTLFLAEIHQAGIFQITQLAPENMEVVLETACPHVLLPFAREAMASLISKGGYPQLLLSPINFQALYHQKKAREAQTVQPSPNARPN